jgi:hypothetical protein
MSGVGDLYSIVALNLCVFNNMQWNTRVFLGMMLSIGLIVIIMLSLYLYWRHVSRQVSNDVRNHILTMWVHTESDLEVGNHRTFRCAIQWDGFAVGIRLLVCVFLSM